MKTPMPPPPLARVMDDLDSDAQRLLDLISRAGDDDEYLPWDKLRYKTPPEGLTHEQWWAGEVAATVQPSVLAVGDDRRWADRLCTSRQGAARA